MASFKFGPLTMKLQYCRKKGDLLFFRRRVPLDLRDQIGRDFFVQSLGTSDPRVAAPLIAKLVKQTDRDWAEMRAPTRAGNLQRAKEILGVDPVQLSDADELMYAEELLDILGDKPVSALPEPHKTALELVNGTREFTVDDCIAEYLEARPGDTDRAERASKYLKEYLKGDRDIRKIRRPDVNGFVKHLLEKDMSTATVQRYLTPLKAAFGRAIRENEMKCENIFARVEIPKMGEDKVDREVFSLDQYRHLDKALVSHEPDTLRSILLVVSDTGARLAEIVGLAKSDLKLDAAVPHIALKPHPWRTLKTPGSTRKIPLTDRAKESLKLAMKRSHDPVHLYPHYSNAEGTSADSASKALVKWVRTREGLKDTKLGNHSLRHGMKDLLRSVKCPSEAADQIIGHKTEGMGANYGEGYPLELLYEWLVQANELKTK
jgi:integrase